MKHCPSEACSYFLETGRVAEYQEHVELCPDCGSTLEDGDAPIRERPTIGGTATEASLFPDEWAAVSAFDTVEGAEWLKDELRDAGIPAVIEKTLLEESQTDEALLESADEEDGAESDSEDIADTEASDLPIYEVRVMARQTVAAMDLLRTLVDNEDEEEDDWAEEDDAFAPEWEDAEWDDAEPSREDGDEIDDAWADSDLDSTGNNLITNPIVVLFILFCVILAIAYQIFVGFPAGL